MNTVLHINVEALNDAFIEDLKKQFGPAELEIRFPERPDNWLTEDRFWELLALLNWSKEGDDELVIAPVVAALVAMPLGNIHQFQDILSEKLWRLDTEAHAAASLRGQPDAPLSVDYFLYDRCCVVANGQDFFEKVLHDPTQMPVGLSFARLLHIAGEAYQQKTGRVLLHVPAYNYETYSNPKHIYHLVTADF